MKKKNIQRRHKQMRIERILNSHFDIYRKNLLIKRLCSCAKIKWTKAKHFLNNKNEEQWQLRRLLHINAHMLSKNFLKSFSIFLASKTVFIFFFFFVFSSLIFRFFLDSVVIGVNVFDDDGEKKIKWKKQKLFCQTILLQ